MERRRRFVRRVPVGIAGSVADVNVRAAIIAALKLRGLALQSRQPLFLDC
jgi:hypothetical protein